jgi:hypothetical protein
MSLCCAVRTLCVQVRKAIEDLLESNEGELELLFASGFLSLQMHPSTPCSLPTCLPPDPPLPSLLNSTLRLR